MAVCARTGKNSNEFHLPFDRWEVHSSNEHDTLQWNLMFCDEWALLLFHSRYVFSSIKAFTADIMAYIELRGPFAPPAFLTCHTSCNVTSYELRGAGWVGGSKLENNIPLPRALLSIKLPIDLIFLDLCDPINDRTTTIIAPFNFNFYLLRENMKQRKRVWT